MKDNGECGDQRSDEGVMKEILRCLRGFDDKQTDRQTDRHLL